MEYTKLEAMFNILNSTLKVDANLLDENEYAFFQKELSEKSDKGFLGFAINLEHLGSKAITMDLFKPKNTTKLKKALNYSKTQRNIPECKAVGRRVFVNLELITEDIELGYSGSCLRREIRGWFEYPVSFRTLVAVVVVHELTHCQLDQMKNKKCESCLFCKHCKGFYKALNKNWDKVLDNDCLRMIDFLSYGRDYSLLEYGNKC